MFSVMSIPMTLPLSFTIFAAKNTSIPAPEPKSTTIFPSCMSANLVGFPQPTPNTDDSGIEFNLSESYPISFDEVIGEIITSVGLQQLSGEGMQQDSMFPLKAIFPYCSLIFSFNCNCLSIGIGLQKKLFKLVRVKW